MEALSLPTWEKPFFKLLSPFHSLQSPLLLREESLGEPHDVQGGGPAQRRSIWPDPEAAGVQRSPVHLSEEP